MSGGISNGLGIAPARPSTTCPTQIFSLAGHAGENLLGSGHGAVLNSVDFGQTNVAGRTIARGIEAWPKCSRAILAAAWRLAAALHLLE